MKKRVSWTSRKKKVGRGLICDQGRNWKKKRAVVNSRKNTPGKSEKIDAKTKGRKVTGENQKEAQKGKRSWGGVRVQDREKRGGSPVKKIGVGPCYGTSQKKKKGQNLKRNRRVSNYRWALGGKQNEEKGRHHTLLKNLTRAEKGRSLKDAEKGGGPTQWNIGTGVGPGGRGG